VSQFRSLIESAHWQPLWAEYFSKVCTYWKIRLNASKIGHQGADLTRYGARPLFNIAESLTAEFGEGSDGRYLRQMQVFFKGHPIWDALLTELSWTHYQTLLRVGGAHARHWYINEAANQNRSIRALNQQIGTLCYERMLFSRNRDIFNQEALAQIAPLQKTPYEFVCKSSLTEFHKLVSSPISILSR
jgi:hypothetical protein